jgi:C1A family cysteine protease
MTCKRATLIPTVVLIFALLSSRVLAYPMYDSVDIGHQIQSQSNWCWAACSSTILDYYSTTVSQSTFVTYVKGYPFNIQGSELDVKNGLAHWNISSVVTTSSMTFSSIMNEIYSYSRPIYAGWSWTGGGSSGHAVLIDGYSDETTDYVDYMDPADGNYHFVTYAWFVGGAGYDHVWDGTVKAIHN